MDKEEDLKEKEEGLDLDYVMATANGRRFLWRLLSYCGIYQDIDVTDQSIAIKQIGKRNVGLFISTILSEHDEQKYFKMMQEARNRAIEEEEKHARRKEDNGRKQYEDRTDRYQSAERGQGISTVGKSEPVSVWI